MKIKKKEKIHNLHWHFRLGLSPLTWPELHRLKLCGWAIGSIDWSQSVFWFLIVIIFLSRWTASISFLRCWTVFSKPSKSRVTESSWVDSSWWEQGHSKWLRIALNSFQLSWANFRWPCINFAIACTQNCKESGSKGSYSHSFLSFLFFSFWKNSCCLKKVGKFEKKQKKIVIAKVARSRNTDSTDVKSNSTFERVKNRSIQERTICTSRKDTS